MKLKLRSRVKFLASIFSGTGTAVRKDGLAAYVDLDYSKLVEITSGVDTGNSQIAIYNKSTQQWNSTTLSTIVTTGILPVVNGGTGASSAFGARANLGLAIGSDVQAYSTNLAAFSGKTAPSGVVVGTTDSQTLTNKAIDTAGGNVIKVNGNTLAASASTATVTLPAATDTLVGRATTDTLTNKTINGANNTISGITNAMRSQMAAYTIKGNATGSTANEADIDITALSVKATPVSGDILLLLDSAASFAFRRVDVSNFLGGGGGGLTDGIRRDIILNSIRNAKSLSSAQPFVDAWTDGFGGNDAINAGASSGYTLDTTNKRVMNTSTPNAPTIIAYNAAGSTNVGNMTGGGGVAAAFDNNTNQAAAASARAVTPGALIGWVGKDYGLGNSHRLGRFRAFAPNNSQLGSGAGTLIRAYGSNVTTGPTTPQDGVLISSGTSANTTAEIYDVTVDSVTAYRWLWITISSSGNTAPADAICAEVQFYDYVAPTISNIVLVGNGYDSLDAVPATLRIAAIFENIDAGTLNTDFKLSVSRDNGVTFTSAPLVAYHTLGTKTFVESAAITVTGQPSGSKPCYKYETLNNKQNYLHGVFIQAA